MSYNPKDPENTMAQEPRSNIYDAEPRRHFPQPDVTRKGFDQMTSKDIDRIIQESGEAKASKGEIRKDTEDHLQDTVGYEATANSDDSGAINQQ
jgi:hypothetical protein